MESMETNDFEEACVAKKPRIVIEDKAEPIRFHVVQTKIYNETVAIHGVDAKGVSQIAYVKYNPACYFRACHGTSVAAVCKTLRTCKGYKENQSHPVHARRFTFYETLGEYFKATFQNEFYLKSAVKEMQKNGFEAFQSDLDPVVRFYASLDFDTHGVIEIDAKLFHNSSCNDPLRTNSLKQLPISAIPNASNICYFDLETYSFDDSFPNAKIKENVVFMIAAIFRRLNAPYPHLVNMYVMGKYREDALELLKARAEQDSPGVKVNIHQFEHEHELLTSFFIQSGQQTPSYYVAHNGFGFDLPYLYYRAIGWKEGEKEYPGCALQPNQRPLAIAALGRPLMPGLDRNNSNVPWLKSCNSKTSAHGDIEIKHFELRGAEHIDTLMYFRKYHSYLPQFSLDFLAETFLKSNKDDVPARQMFKGYREGDVELNTKTLLYCYQDVNLLVKLDQKMAVVTSIPVYGSVFCVPSSFVLLRGQTVRVVGHMVRAGNARKGDMIVVESRVRGNKDDEDIMTDEKYEGATVLEAKKGFYEKNIVATLDFASLYPSIQMAYFICPTLYLPDEESAKKAGIYEQYEVEINTVDIKTKKKISSEVREARLLVQGANGTRVVPLMPQVLCWLKALRKSVKKEMEVAELANDMVLAKALDAKQLAIKVSMNSMYGFLGATSNHLMRKELAALITLKGRTGLKRVCDYLMEKYPSKIDILYGDTDSVMILLLDIEANMEGAMRMAFDTGKKYAKEVSNLLSFERATSLSALLNIPIEDAYKEFIALVLEFEKCYGPYLLIDKKMYAAAKYVDPKPDELNKVEVKGIQMARRSVAKVVRDRCKQVMDDLMKRRDRQLAINNTIENGRVILNDPVADLTHWEMSAKLNSKYKVNATILPEVKNAASIKVEVHYDGKWRCISKKDWVKFLKYEPETIPEWLPATNGAYKDWFLLDNDNKKVGRVSISQPQVHVSRDVEETAFGSGPRPGDRVRYVIMEDPHEKAAGGILSLKAAYAFSFEKAAELLQENKRVQHSRFFEVYRSGVTSFMNIVDPSIDGTLLGMGNQATLKQAAKTKTNIIFGKREQEGNRDIGQFFTIETRPVVEKRKNRWEPFPKPAKKSKVEEPSEKEKNILQSFLKKN